MPDFFSVFKQNRCTHTSCLSPISFADGRPSCACCRALLAVVVSKSFSSAVFSKRISSRSSCSSAISCFAASSSVAYLPPELLRPRQENKETTDCRCDGADLSDLGDPPPDTPVKDLARGRHCRGELERGEIEEATSVTQCERVVLRDVLVTRSRSSDMDVYLSWPRYEFFQIRG